MTVTVNLWLIHAALSYTLIGLASTMCMDAKATPTNNTDYSYHIKAIVLF